MSSTITEVIFIIDKSGSMRPLKEDTIGGYNSFVEKQKEGKGECYLSTILFSTDQKKIIDHESIEKAKAMTGEDYQTSGNTALLDALGNSINEMSEYLKAKKDKRKIIFVIITDGMENASKEYDLSNVRQMIEEKQKEDWEFIYLASNLDAFAEAKNMGICPKHVANYRHSGESVTICYEGISKAVRQMRDIGSIDESWHQEIDKDYKGVTKIKDLENIRKNDPQAKNNGD